jgi:hypothetical protein
MGRLNIKTWIFAKLTLTLVVTGPLVKGIFCVHDLVGIEEKAWL